MKDTWFPNRSNAALFYPEIAERAHQKGWKTYLFYSAPKRLSSPLTILSVQTT